MQYMAPQSCVLGMLYYTKWIWNLTDSIAQLNVFGPNVEKGTSELTDSIAQLDVFEENGSEKRVPELLQPL